MKIEEEKIKYPWEMKLRVYTSKEKQKFLCRWGEAPYYGINDKYSEPYYGWFFLLGIGKKLFHLKIRTRPFFNEHHRPAK